MRNVAGEWAKFARGVAPWAFDLNDVGAEVGEELGSVWAADVLGEIDDGEAVQRSGHVRTLRDSAASGWVAGRGMLPRVAANAGTECVDYRLQFESGGRGWPSTRQSQT